MQIIITRDTYFFRLCVCLFVVFRITKEFFTHIYALYANNLKLYENVPKNKFNIKSAVTWLKYCRHGENLYSINQSKQKPKYPLQNVEEHGDSKFKNNNIDKIESQNNY